MAKFIIHGGKPLIGKINVLGAKNAALPIMAATILSDEEFTIGDVPHILDVEILAKILRKIGANVKWQEKNVLKINCSKIFSTSLDPSLVRQLRASILLMGPLLARKGKMDMRHPGGCIIGKRPVGVHFDALRKLGAEISQDQESYFVKSNSLHCAEIYLSEPSVTATENIIMASTLLPGRTVIKFAAEEPHIVDLIKFLNQAGAKIQGAGTHRIEIEGVKKLNGTRFTLSPDPVEVGTYAAAIAATGGHGEIKKIYLDDLDPVIDKLIKMNVKLEIGYNEIKINKSDDLKATKIQTNPWPGFPTDLQAPFAVLATQAAGTTLIHDWMYERRLFYIDELIKMGANITLCDPHRALITGPSKLYGTDIATPDIRAGIALIIAGIVAKGTTQIDHVELIDRGYEDIEIKLQGLGADIKRVNNHSKGVKTC